MSQRTITAPEARRLLRLLKRARAYNWKLDDIHMAALAITGEADEFGHTFDAVIQGSTKVDRLLGLLQLQVVDGRKANGGKARIAVCASGSSAG